MADAPEPNAPRVPAPAGSPAQVRSYYLQLAMAQLHCAAAALAVGDVLALRAHLDRARAAIDHTAAIR